MRKHNEELQQTIETITININHMSNYIDELEKLILDDVKKEPKKGKKRNRRKKRKGKK